MKKIKMKLPSNFRFDKESSILKLISSTHCCSNVECPRQIPLSPKIDVNRNTSMLWLTNSNPTKGIQEHLPAYRSEWSLNLQGKTPRRDKSRVNTPPVKAPSLLRTTAMLKNTDSTMPLMRRPQTTQRSTQKIQASTQKKKTKKKSPMPNLLQMILLLLCSSCLWTTNGTRTLRKRRCLLLGELSFFLRVDGERVEEERTRPSNSGPAQLLRRCF
jgi:hypothetical protein